MPKQQINIKLPPELIEALKLKATDLGVTLTGLIQNYCEQGLKLPSSSRQFDFDELYNCIVATLDKRIPAQIENRIANQVVTLYERLQALEQGLNEVMGEIVA